MGHFMSDELTSLWPFPKLKTSFSWNMINHNFEISLNLYIFTTLTPYFQLCPKLSLCMLTYVKDLKKKRSKSSLLGHCIY